MHLDRSVISSEELNLVMYFYMVGAQRIELVLLESKSSVLPLHQPPTKSRIFKEQGEILSHVDIIVNPLKQKNPRFSSRVLVSKLKFILLYLPKPPVSFSMAYPNCGRDDVQLPFTNGRCFLIVADIQCFIIEGNLTLN